MEKVQNVHSKLTGGNGTQRTHYILWAHLAHLIPVITQRFHPLTAISSTLNLAGFCIYTPISQLCPLKPNYIFLNILNTIHSIQFFRPLIIYKFFESPRFLGYLNYLHMDLLLCMFPTLFVSAL